MSDRHWRDDAACRDHPKDIFFTQWPPKWVVAAKKVCAQCPVTKECLELAMGFDADIAGVFGGLTPRERDNYRRTGVLPVRPKVVVIPEEIWKRSAS
jgi:WhiB family redox-sensing transcriptional regulator